MYMTLLLFKDSMKNGNLHQIKLLTIHTIVDHYVN